MQLDRKKLCNAVRDARQKSGLTQERAAELTGLSLTYYKYLEAGRRLPALDTLFRVATTLNMSVDALIFGNVPETDSTRERIIRRLGECSTHDLEVVFATVEALLKKEEHQSV